MVETKIRKGERFESLLRRHNKRVLSSGFLQSFKDRRYAGEAINSNLQKKHALFGLGLKKNREYLQKIGKYKEEK